jgi:2',3'-cyclic-nucleotide 2'-phosphodiesterase (5'-nucleotidase family)
LIGLDESLGKTEYKCWNETFKRRVKMDKDSRISIILTLILILIVPTLSFGQVTFTLLHTNDVHGQLEPSGSNPGMARVAQVINDQRTALGSQNVLLVDAGDEMQGSLLSNLGKGLPTIAIFNAMGYAAATFGNHDFDWGQVVLNDRTTQATYPFVTANIVVNDTGNCSTAGWTTPSFAQPYVVQTLNTILGTVKVGLIGVTTTETPLITIASATAGLCFKDPLLRYTQSTGRCDCRAEPPRVHGWRLRIRHPSLW